MSTLSGFHAGLLNRYIRIESPQHRLDDSGSTFIEWELHTHIWAYLHRCVVSNETSHAMQRRPSMRAILMIRSPHTLTSAMRCVIEGEYWHIEGIVPDSGYEHIMQCRIRREVSV